ncbi:MAG: MOSC domain-containing protein [Chloroflexi bacterium]|nr:MOSC domain-containing protein [Chloroflexota bacterium]MBE3127493.1 MOSC domain-containing protein [Candidatus Atribacteria bacterium]
MKGKIVAVCRSEKKGTIKKEIAEGLLIKDFGLERDAHSGKWLRQISLLGVESINKMKGKGFKIIYGDFAENLTVEGIVLYQLPLGTKLKVGENVLLEVTQIGKECHHGCEIRKKIGDCVMPREGIFARVLEGGKVKAGDEIEVVSG